MGKSGTGLGMAVVWGAVQDHEGVIETESEVGAGTTFRLYLPLTTSPPPLSPEAVPVDSYTGRGETVLIVDDVEQQRDIATRMLESLDYSPVAVPSGEAAIEFMRDHEAGLVLLDMIMDPGMDGLDTYRRILDLRPGQRAIVVSGYSETERIRLAQSLGAGTCVSKPYDRATLGVAVRQELDRPRPARQ
jgi:two-component system cell cycle sensor histidine kinase/response regulator CckA